MRIRQQTKHNVTGKFFICSLVNTVICNGPIQQLLVDEENISCPLFIYFLNTNVFSVQETWHKWSCSLQALAVLTPMKRMFSTYWMEDTFNPLKPKLNPICYLLALLAHHFLHVSRIRIKLLTFRRLMSYIYGAPILDVSRSHTMTQHSR